MYTEMSPRGRKNVKVVVLGDIGRSPRMQYHSLSLAEMGHQVDIIGYGSTEPMEAVKLHPQILYHYLLPVPVIRLKFVNYVFKTIFQTLNLLFLMFVTSKSDIVLVQNPPAIPSLVVCWIYCRIIGAKLIIDWHNYAYTIMALSVGPGNALVKVTKKFEEFVGQKADFNFCVTKAMKEDLGRNWNIKAATTLYDRPMEIFKPVPSEVRHEFLENFGKKYGTALTGDKKPGLLVSSTSWTEDEDFSVLLSALQEYEDHHKSGNLRNLPRLVCVITGKGPLKDYYVGKIAERNWENVKVITPWLETSEYPLILASADLGVSLHTSSSGLDLPMKVVDMFGCGLPVCAYDFKWLNRGSCKFLKESKGFPKKLTFCNLGEVSGVLKETQGLKELVRHGENGFVFRSPQELSELILNWFEDFPNNKKQQGLERKLKKELETFQNLRWKENWTKIAAPAFE